MNEKNYWRHFFSTGKVEDYLKYKQCLNEEKKQETKELKVKEESPYAGFHHGDGNCN